MIFDFTDREYRTDCVDGCGFLTDWLTSGMVAEQVSRNHENSMSHRCAIEERLKREDEFLLETQ